MRLTGTIQLMNRRAGEKQLLKKSLLNNLPFDLPLKLETV